MAKNRSDDARRVATVIADYEDPDPFKWVDLADNELAAERYESAISYYKKAQRQAPYLHQPPAGLAKAYFYMGHRTKAIAAIKQALENTHDHSLAALYQAKYDYLKSK